MKRAEHEAVAAELRRCAALEAQRHIVSAWNVKLVRAAPRPRLVGSLLTPSHERRLGALRTHWAGRGFDLDDHVTRLTAHPPALGFGRPAAERLDVCSHPVPESASARAQASLLATQVDDPVTLLRLLAEWRGWLLVELPEGTRGWVEGRHVRAADPGGEPASAPRPATEIDDHLLTNYCTVRYLLGGTTRQGWDCSGLVQRVLRENAGVVVPRHARDQARVGRLVAPTAEPRSGDLLFMLSASGALHVGLTLRSGSVLHASSSRGRTVCEPLADLPGVTRVWRRRLLPDPAPPEGANVGAPGPALA